MYSHPLSAHVSSSGVTTTGANLAEKRSVTGNEAVKAAEHQPSADVKALWWRLRQVPEVRANVVADAAARLRSGELMARADFESLARAIPQPGVK